MFITTLGTPGNYVHVGATVPVLAMVNKRNAKLKLKATSLPLLFWGDGSFVNLHHVNK